MSADEQFSPESLLLGGVSALMAVGEKLFLSQVVQAYRVL